MSGTPVQDLLDQISVTEHQFNLQSDYVIQVRALRKRLAVFSRFSLSPAASKHASSLGIPHDPQAPGVHTHPLSKLVEDYLLYVELVPLLNSFKSACVLSMGRAKFKKLAQHTTTPLRSLPLVVCPKDRLQYGDTAEPAGEGKCVVNELVSYSHYTAHNFTPADVITLFRNSPNMIHHFASVVIPPELVLGVLSNRTPLYEYEIRNGEMIYAPDGYWPEAYRQPANCVWLLKTQFLQDMGLFISVLTVRQLDSTFLLCFSRGKTLVQNRQTASSTSVTVLEDQNPGFSGAILSRLRDKTAVHTDALNFMVSYTRSVSVPTRVNLRSRLRIWLDGHKWCVLDEHAQTRATETCLVALSGQQVTGSLPGDQSTFVTLLSLGLFGSYGILSTLDIVRSRLRQDRESKRLSFRPCRFDTHTEPYQLTSLTPLSPYFSGKFPERSAKEIRAIVKSVLFQPENWFAGTPEYYGSGALPSLTRRGLKTLFRLTALTTLITAPCYCGLRKLLPKVLLPYDWVLRYCGIPFLVASVPVTVQATGYASMLGLKGYTVFESWALDRLTPPIRSRWMHLCRIWPVVSKADFALHSLIYPVDAPLSYHLDPALSFALGSSDGKDEDRSWERAREDEERPAPSETTETEFGYDDPDNGTGENRDKNGENRDGNEPPPEGPFMSGGLPVPPSVRTTQHFNEKPWLEFRYNKLDGAGEELPDDPLALPAGSNIRVDVDGINALGALVVFCIGGAVRTLHVLTHDREGSNFFAKSMPGLRLTNLGADLIFDNPHYNRAFETWDEFPGLPSPLGPNVFRSVELGDGELGIQGEAAIKREINNPTILFTPPHRALPVIEDPSLIEFPLGPNTLLVVPSVEFRGGSGILNIPRRKGQCLLDCFETVRTWEEICRATHTTLGDKKTQAYLVQPFPLGTLELPCLAKELNVRVEAELPTGKRWYGQGLDLKIKYSTGHWSVSNKIERGSDTGRKFNPEVRKNRTLSALLNIGCGKYYANYRISLKRAKIAAEALYNKNIGKKLAGDEKFFKQCDSLINAPPNHVERNVRMRGRLGEPGTGKSYYLLKLCEAYSNANPETESYTVIVGTNDLRDEVSKTLQLQPGKGYRVKTWENALVEPARGCIIFDDAGKMFPVLDLFLLLHPCADVYFTGDTAQNVVKLPTNARGWIAAKPCLDILARGAGMYLRGDDEGRRLATGVASILGVGTTSSKGGDFIFRTSPSCPMVVCTPGARALFSDLGRTTYSVDSCQGVNIKGDYLFLLSPQLAFADDRAVYTALTRGDRNVFIAEERGKISSLARSTSPILRGLVDFALTMDPWRLQVAVREHRIRHTPPHLSDPTRSPGVRPPPLDELLQEYTGGNIVLDLVARFLKSMRPVRTHQPLYVGDWYCGKSNYNEVVRDAILSTVQSLQPHIEVLASTVETEDMPRKRDAPPNKGIENMGEELPFDGPLDYSAWPPHKLLTQPECITELVESIAPNASVHGREIFVRSGLLTEQITKEDYATAIFLKHRRKDKATEEWTFKERYVPPPQRLSLTYYGAGYALFQAFLNTYNPARIPFQESIFERCLEEDYAALLDKGPKALSNIAYRNCAYLDPQKAETFLKSQDITKLGTEFRNAKKGQMVTGFCTLVNVRFGPMTRYFFSALRTSLPPEILLLNGVTLDALEEWFLENWDFSGPCFSDDFTGFDGSQNEDFLGYQVYLFYFYMIPAHWVRSYVEFVCHIVVLMGLAGIWIASGLKPTWVINTVDNMGYQALKYKLTPHAPYCGPGVPRVRGKARSFSGDDSSQNEKLVVRPSFGKLPHKFKLVSTGYYEDVPHFCGTVNTPVGTFTDPRLLLLRVLFKARNGTLFQSCLGYAELCSRLQRKIGKIAPHLSSSELSDHAHTVRILRLYLRARGIPVIGFFLVRWIGHWFNLEKTTKQL